MKHRCFWGLLLALVWIAGCGDSSNSSPAQTGLESTTPHPGKALMTQYCGLCHAVPVPGDLDKKTWQDYILVRMGAYMGIYYDNVRFHDSVPTKWLEPGEGGKRVLAEGIYPSQPMLSQEDFMAIREYILETAPGVTSGPVGAFGVPKDLSGFRARPIRLDTFFQPFVSAVEIAEEEGLIYAGMFMQPLVVIDKAGKLVDSLGGYVMPVQVNADGAGESGKSLGIVDIGSMGGSDNPSGSYQVAKSLNDLRSGRIGFERNQLMRPVQAHWADLDGDNDEDVLLCEFGYHLGQMTWQENRDGEWVEHVLYPDDGGVAAGICDFDGDGLVDIAALHANSDEKLVVYENQGGGEFKANRIARYAPSQGGAALELADVDGDGLVDLVTSSGDNGDYPPTLKPVHGVRVYKNRGGFQFDEQLTLPVNGAYGTQCRDFDLDGDMDIASLAYYPDYKSRPEEAFILFEQTAPWQFEPHSFAEVGLSRWMVMDAGDIDQDGDEDIVLGAFNVRYDDKGDAATYANWMNQNVPLLILENTARSPLSK